MTILPPELWIEAVSTLRVQRSSPEHHTSTDTTYWSTLRTICLVSSAFRSISQPLLFEELVLGADQVDVKERLEGLDHLLDNRPESAQWTKAIVLIGMEPSSPGADEKEKLMAKLFQRLTGVRNIRIASFHHTTAEVIQHLQRLEGPLILSIHHSSVPGIHLANESSSLRHPVSALKELHSDGAVAHSPGLLISPTLERLVISQTGFDYMINLCLQNRQMANFANLLYLEVPVPLEERLPGFLSMLSSTPNLIRLALKRWIQTSDSEVFAQTVPPTLIPALTSFEGPLPYVRLFVPGRPVKDITMMFTALSRTELTREDVRVLSESTAAEKQLNLMFCLWTEGSLAVLAEFMPGIQELSATLVTTMVSNGADLRSVSANDTTLGYPSCERGRNPSSPPQSSTPLFSRPLCWRNNFVYRRAKESSGHGDGSWLSSQERLLPTRRILEPRGNRRVDVYLYSTYIHTHRSTQE